MEREILQIIMAAFISLGFSLLFQIRRNLLPWTSVGGVINWGSYVLFVHLLGGLFVPSLLSSVVCACYAEAMARIKKTPAIVILIPTLIPSIPGRSLYNTVSALVQKDMDAAGQFGIQTGLYVLAIAAGISMIWALSLTIQRFSQLRRDKINEQRGE